jgi:hypothetical protein
MPDPINLAGDAILDPLPAAVSKYVVGTEGTRHAAGAHGVVRVHQLEVKMWGGGVAGVADATEHVAVLHGPTRRDRNRTRRQVGESGKDVATPHDHVVAEERRQAIGAECHGVLEGEDWLAQRMDPSSLGSTIGGAHDLAIERCVNFGPPGVAQVPVLVATLLLHDGVWIWDDGGGSGSWQSRTRTGS